MIGEGTKSKGYREDLFALIPGKRRPLPLEKQAEDTSYIAFHMQLVLRPLIRRVSGLVLPIVLKDW